MLCYRVSADGYGLTLLIANVGHTARYTCIATNKAGSADKDFDLDVLGMTLTFFTRLPCVLGYKRYIFPFL